MSEKKRDQGQEEPPKAVEKKAPEEGEKKKPPYVFKILPADPKNSFDFEDVADK